MDKYTYYIMRDQEQKTDIFNCNTRILELEEQIKSIKDAKAKKYQQKCLAFVGVRNQNKELKAEKKKLKGIIKELKKR